MKTHTNAGEHRQFLDRVVRDAWDFISIFPVLSSVFHELEIDKQQLLLL